MPNQMTSELTALATDLFAVGDLFVVLDVSDTTQGAGGTLKTVTAIILNSGLAGGKVVVGGSAAGEALTLRATSNATPGPVIVEVEPGVEAARWLATLELRHAGTVQPTRTEAVSNGALESGVTAVYHGDGLTTTAVLTLTNVALTVGDNENLGTGVLIFTLPAGNLTIIDCAMSVDINGIDDSDATPDVGIGTVIASGAITALGGTSTFENIIFGTAAADCNGTATVASGRDPANFGAGFQVLSGAAHTVHFNQAGTYSDEVDFVGVINGTVTITYRHNFA